MTILDKIKEAKRAIQGKKPQISYTKLKNPEERLEAIERAFEAGEFGKLVHHIGAEVHYIYEDLSDFARDHPDRVYAAAKKALKNANTPDNEFKSLANHALSEVAAVKPEYAEEAIITSKQLLDSGEFDLGYYDSIYDDLKRVAKANPNVDEVKKLEQSIKALGDMKKAFFTGKYDKMVKEANSYTLPKIAKDFPDELFKTAQTGILGGKHDEWSLAICYMAIKEAVKANPKLAKDAVEVIKNSMAHEKNNSSTLVEAYNALGSIAEVNPKVALEAEQAIKEGLESSKNDDFSHNTAKDNLKKISSQIATRAAFTSKFQSQK
jgi:tetratricopeptide (TPR) repeat protein